MMSESFRGMNPTAVDTLGTALTDLSERLTTTANSGRESFGTVEWHGTDASTFETDLLAMFDEVTELGTATSALADNAVKEAAEQRTVSAS